MGNKNKNKDWVDRLFFGFLIMLFAANMLMQLKMWIQSKELNWSALIMCSALISVLVFISGQYIVHLIELKKDKALNTDSHE